MVSDLALAYEIERSRNQIERLRNQIEWLRNQADVGPVAIPVNWQAAQHALVRQLPRG